MVSRFCFVYVIFCFVALLILAIFLRDANRRMFYELHDQEVQRVQLKQQLWQKQLQLASAITPSEVGQRVTPKKSEE
jgi:hypothetical protein